MKSKPANDAFTLKDVAIDPENLVLAHALAITSGHTVASVFTMVMAIGFDVAREGLNRPQIAPEFMWSTLHPSSAAEASAPQ